jgi:hypothetical protein
LPGCTGTLIWKYRATFKPTVATVLPSRIPPLAITSNAANRPSVP